jgi:hypothetical protein
MWGTFTRATFHWGDSLLKRVSITCALVVVAAMMAMYGYRASASETLYRWMDEAGNPVNSDRPPPQGVKYEVISTSSSMVRKVGSDEGAVPLKVKPSADNDFQQVDTSKPKIEKNSEFCDRAKENLAALDSNIRIQMRNDKGEVHYLSAEEREVERKKALDTIKANCE